MKIATVELYQVELPYSGGVHLLSGGREYRSFGAAIVRVVADDGTEGWGGSTPFGSTYVAARVRGARAGIEEIAPHLLGRDPRQTDRIHDRMGEVLLGHDHVKATIDAACWDLLGKALGRPAANAATSAAPRASP